MNFSMRLATQMVLNEIKEGKNKNVLTSPLSTNIMLNMVATGSRGRTLEQLLGCLESKSVHELNLVSSKLVALANGHHHEAASSGVGGRQPSFQDVAQTTHKPDTKTVDIIKQMMIGEAQVPSKRCGPMLSFVNGVWFDRRFTLKPSFEEIAKNVFKADARSVDFLNKADKVVDEVNSWVKHGTNGLIKNFLPKFFFGNDTMLVLANALYFKGAWKDVFETFMTQHEDFHLLNGKTIKVPFMAKRNEKHFFGSFDGFKLLKLPYECDDDPVKDNRKFSMYVYLPDEKKGLEKLTQNFDSNPFKLLQHCTWLEKVELSNMLLPKFKFSYEFLPSDTMKGLGLNLPFKDVGELTEMVYSDKVFVSHILQKCFIEVNEEGTEAAAITALLMDLTCPRDTTPPPSLPSFVADHPFLFLIKEEMSGVVVFAGAVLNPGSVD